MGSRSLNYAGTMLTGVPRPGAPGIRLAAVAIATFLALAAIACRSGGGAISTTTPAPTTARPVAATPATVRPTIAPTGSPAASPAASPAPATAIPSARPITGLKLLSGYRYTMHWEIGGIQSLLADRLCRLEGNPKALRDPFVVDVRGTALAPDKLETFYRPNCINGEFAIITLGKQQWLRLSDGTVVRAAFQGSLDEINHAVELWDQNLMRAVAPIGCPGERRELLNGVSTRHCRIGWGTIQQLASLFGVNISKLDDGEVADLTLDLWLHEGEGYPVRLRITLRGVDEKGKAFQVKGELDVADVNNPTLQILPPP